MKAFQKFGVIGGGAWGTALAAALLYAGREVVLWARNPDVVASINQRHTNDLYLPEVQLDPALSATESMEELTSCEAWLWVVPVQYTRAISQDFAKACPAFTKPILVCSKGIEVDTLLFPASVLQDSFQQACVGVLSGPSFAREVAQGKPTAITLACADEALGMTLCQALGSKNFRPYYSDDVIGAQIGGAIKNVLAIGTGIAAGCGMGDNARAALITRGLAEMMRLGQALKARPETLMGLSGLGDLVLTCSSPQSRNMSLGYALGEGQTVQDILSGRKSVAEGVPTTAATATLAQKYGVDMPIVRAVNHVLSRGENVREAIDELLDRPLRPERE